jgi:hypothetical protein
MMRPITYMDLDWALAEMAGNQDLYIAKAEADQKVLVNSAGAISVCKTAIGNLVTDGPKSATASLFMTGVMAGMLIAEHILREPQPIPVDWAKLRKDNG